MGSSSLDLDNEIQPDRKLGKAHGADALGPSDSSDSGSDVGNFFDDSDTDTAGTGERASVERETKNQGKDVGFDRLENLIADDDQLDTDELNDRIDINEEFANDDSIPDEVDKRD